MALGGFLRQSTAVDILIGPFLDEDDGKTAETGLTLSQADIKLSKNGQALAQKNDVTAASHDSDGYYNCELDATDTNTVGQLTVIVHESGALPVRHEYQVVAENVHEWHVAKSGNDSNGGHSFEDALLTAVEAIDNRVAGGDTVIVHPGTYAGGLNFADKEINLKGKHHTKCLITAASEAAIKGCNGSIIENISVYSDTPINDFGINLSQDNFVRIRNCKIFGNTDGIKGSWNIRDIIIEGCAVSSGYDAINAVGFVRGIVKSSSFYSDGSYGNAPARGGYLGGHADYDNCHFEGLKAIASVIEGAFGVSNWGNADMNLTFLNSTFIANTTHADSLANATGFYAGGDKKIRLTFMNCTFEANVTNGDGDAYGFHLNTAGAKVVCMNCTFKSNSENGVDKDIKVDTGSLTLLNCSYDPAKVSGTIIKDITSALTTAQLDEFAKILSRSVQ